MTVTQRLNELEKRIRELEKKRNIKAPIKTLKTKTSPKTKRKTIKKKKATKKNFSMRAYGWSTKEEKATVRHAAIDRAIQENGHEEVQKFFVKMSRMHNQKPTGTVFKADLVYINKK
jgi:hypothetical protein